MLEGLTQIFGETGAILFELIVAVLAAVFGLIVFAVFQKKDKKSADRVAFMLYQRSHKNSNDETSKNEDTRNDE